jgi:ubiquinone biosynthesis protein
VKLRVLGRLMEIHRVLTRHGLVEFTRGSSVYPRLRLLSWLSPWLWLQRPSTGARGERLRLALEQLGPVFVKFGQAISTRRDLLPADIADELVKLQDSVPPFPGETARKIVQESLGQPVGHLFASFDTTALAAASIAQVHAATLLDGREVIVKVLRPGMREQITRDIEVLQALARLVVRYSPEGRRLRPTAVVSEYEKTILDELDLLREAANATHLKRNFAGKPELYVPEVHWDLCRRDVMVMERIHGVQIGDVARLRALGTDLKYLAETGVAIFFTQVFRHNFFHADMHPGNIFVLTDDPRKPRYAAVDFGIVGTLDPVDQNYLAQNFLAVFDRDYRKVATLHVESGWVPRDIRIAEMESAVRTICEPIFEKPLKDISFGVVLLRLFEVLRRFDAQIQPQLILLQKTLFNIEGLGRQLYPDLDIWNTANPILREWMRDQRHPVSVAKRLWKQMPTLLQALENAPEALKQQMQSQAMRMPLSQSVTPVSESCSQAGSYRIAGAILILAATVSLTGDRGPQWLGWLLAIVGAAGLLRRAS